MKATAGVDWCEVVDALAEKHDRKPHALMGILQDLQMEYGHVCPDAQIEVALALGISPTHVSDVISFYHFLCSEPKGQYVVWLCQTISCDMADKDQIAKALSDELGISFGETTDDGLFTLEYTNCMGMCDQAPAMLVNDEVHVSLTPDSAREIIAGYRREGGLG